MKLAEFSADLKRRIHADLAAGNDPQQGAWDADLLKEARARGEARMGATSYAPDEIRLEFLFGDAPPTVVTVSVTPPERIVFLPVPGWVKKTIWQGHVEGTPHFEQEAMSLVEEFRARLAEEANKAEFGPQAPERRE